MDLETFISLVRVAKDKERDDRLFQQWVVQLPVMAQYDSYTSFEDYKRHMTGADIDTRPTEELLRELDDIEAQFHKGENPNGNI